MKEHGKGYKLRLFFIGLMSVLMGLLEFLGLALIFPFVALMMGNEVLTNIAPLNSMVEAMNMGGNKQLLACIICSLLIAIYIFKNLFMIFCIKYQGDVMLSLQNKIFCETLENLIYSPYLKINSMTIGEKQTLCYTAPNAAIWGFAQRVIQLLSNAIIALCILAFLFYKFPLPALATSLFLGAFVLCEVFFFKKRAKSLGAQLLEVTQKQSSIFNYTVHGIKEIKTSANRGFFIEELEKSYKTHTSITKLLTLNGLYPVYVTEIGIITAFGILAGLIFCFAKDSSAAIVPSFAVVAAITLRLVPVLNKFQSSMFSINSQRAQTVWFLDRAKELKNCVLKEPETEPIPFNEKICLKGVNFSYKKDGKQTLKDINLEIKKGDFVGIIGLSGGGKTTLCDILTGLIQPDTGEFYIDNLKITSENIRGWHRRISILPQDFYLMPSSILDNICYGDKEQDIERVETALKAAEIYENVKDVNSKPELSHGQKHRIALARALYKNSDVLFLDEATSSLDIETEDKVSKSIANLKGKKTILAIAHRLTTLKNCDYLLYMKEGEIIDKGTFRELKERHEDFENMLKLSSFSSETV